MTMNIGLDEKSRKGVCEILNHLLADEFILYTETLNFHWNVTGLHFHDLHKFFESQYEELFEMVDGVAERIRTLGKVAPGSLSELSALSRIKEKPKKNMTAQKMIALLVEAHESIIQYVREDLVTCDKEFGDVGTNDFLTGLMEKHEKMVWMLRVCLEK